MIDPIKRFEKIFVAGHRGLAGSAVVRRLTALGYQNVLARTHSELDLCDRERVLRFFEQEKPQAVVLAAAKVGGILANSRYPADFLVQNLRIQDSVINAAYHAGVRRLIFLGSSCIYPRDAEQPLHETALLSGPLEATNRPYAIAKIAGLEACWGYNRQYGTGFVVLMPTNLYGPGDNYDLENSHVLPALIRKVHTSKVNGAPEVVIWGTGTPKREFLHSDDLGAACEFMLTLPTEKYAELVGNTVEPPLLNVGWGKDLTIRELAELVCDVVGFTGRLQFDSTKPDGTPRKLLDNSRIASFGWKPTITLREGLIRTYKDFLGEQQGKPLTASETRG